MHDYLLTYLLTCKGSTVLFAGPYLSALESFANTRYTNRHYYYLYLSVLPQLFAYIFRTNVLHLLVYLLFLKRNA